MGLLTSIFNLFKPEKTDPAVIARINEDLDIIDTEMARPPLTVNGEEPDSERNISISTVELANNLTSDEAQINTGEFIIRTSGGEASINDGPAWLTSVRGNTVKTGVVEEVLNMTITPIDPSSETAIDGTMDENVFRAYVATSGTVTLTYTNAWNADPVLYGITLTGTPVAGDQITINYTKGNRGTIAAAEPTGFVSTGWNLYNHALGYARVVNYSEEQGYRIDGTYTSLEFSETLTGGRVSIIPVNGAFVVPGTGYLFVTGGNTTDTAIWAAWGDWTDEPGEVFQAYTETTIDLTGAMVNFPNGLLKVGNVADEINLNTQRAYSRISRIAYSDENLDAIVAMDVEYDTDEAYIYYVSGEPAVYTLSIDGEYNADDHGMEYFNGTAVPVQASTLYGQNLKGKLQRDVLTISQQTLTAAQQAQARTNIGAASQADMTSLNDSFTNFSNTNIAANTDMNDLTDVGFYSCPSSATAATLAHTPITTGGFGMIVLRRGSYRTQFIPSGSMIFIRTSSSAGWGSWYSFTGTAVS